MSALLEGVGRGSPEEVLLQGWGYGRTRTDPFPPKNAPKTLPKLRGLHLFLPHSFSMGLQQLILFFQPLEC